MLRGKSQEVKSEVKEPSEQQDNQGNLQNVLQYQETFGVKKSTKKERTETPKAAQAGESSRFSDRGKRKRTESPLPSDTELNIKREQTDSPDIKPKLEEEKAIQENSSDSILGTDFYTLNSSQKVDRLKTLLTSDQLEWYDKWKSNMTKSEEGKYKFLDIHTVRHIYNDVITNELNMLNSIRSIIDDKSDNKGHTNEEIRKILNLKEEPEFSS